MSTTIVDSELRARLTQVIESFGSVVMVAKAVGYRTTRFTNGWRGAGSRA